MELAESTSTTAQSATRFKRLTVTCPPRIVELVDEAAARNFQSHSEFTRRAIIDRLRADGVLELNDAE